MTGFDQFWAVYPRRDARKDALKAWGQVNGDDALAAILEALTWQAPLWRLRDRCFTPLPASYLRGERWTDENPAEAIERQRQAEREADKARTADRERRYDEWNARKQA